VKQIPDKLLQDILNIIADGKQNTISNGLIFQTVQEVLKLPTIPEISSEKGLTLDR
jgi:hypothetical protein